MSILVRWARGTVDRAQDLPLVRGVPATARRSAAGGLVWGAFLLCFVAALLGVVNRGLLGLVIGSASGALLGAAVGLVIGVLWGRRRAADVSRISLYLTLDRKEPRYAPGESVSGYVQLETQTPVRIDGLRLFFVCRGFFGHAVDGAPEQDGGEPTLERKSVEYLVQQQEVLPAGPIQRTACATHPFSFSLPVDGLPTHDGYACAVRWSIHAVLDLDGDEPVHARQQLFVESMPPLLTPARGSYQSESSHPDCDLTISLPNVVVAEGEPVEARLRIAPREPMAVREVRAVLVRVESTPEGDDHTVYVEGWDKETGRFFGHRRPGGAGTTYVWLEDEVALLEPDQAELPHALITTVSLQVPRRWRPTLRTRDGSVVWKLGVVVTREDAEDLRVFHEVVVHTGDAEITRLLDPQHAPVDQPAAE